MKAIVQEAYGLPDVLKLREVETPSIDDKGVLVQVHAASVNALDWHITRGLAYLVRIGGLRVAEESIRVLQRTSGPGRGRPNVSAAVLGGPVNGVYALK